MGMIGFVVIDRETISSVSDSTGFTATYIPPLNVETAYAIVQAVGGSVRFCIDGTTPTSSKGMRLTQDSKIEVWGYAAMVDFRAIDDGGTATLEVIYMGRG